MRDFYLIGFILLLPALAVLGHDIYLAYTNIDLQGTDSFWLSDLGWLWINYAPDSYDWATGNLDSAIWTAFVDPVLQQSALYIALIPFVILVVTLILMKILGTGPFEGRGLNAGGQKIRKSKKGEIGFAGGEAKQRAKYKRK